MLLFYHTFGSPPYHLAHFLLTFHLCRYVDVVLRMLNQASHILSYEFALLSHHSFVCLYLRHRYVDVVLRLLEKAGDQVSDDIWHRVVQLVTNNSDMQQYATTSVVGALQRGAKEEVRRCVFAVLCV